jgi:hypothetical protein
VRTCVRACVRACTRRLTCPLLPNVNARAYKEPQFLERLALCTEHRVFEEPVGAPLEALSSPLQQVGACGYNTGHTTQEGRAAHRG